MRKFGFVVAMALLIISLLGMGCGAARRTANAAIGSGSLSSDVTISTSTPSPTPTSSSTQNPHTVPANGIVFPVNASRYEGSNADYEHGYTKLYRDRTSPAANYYEGIGCHPGLDIAADYAGAALNTSTTVHCMYDGEVYQVLTGYGGGWGNCITIKHTTFPAEVGVIYSSYAHLDRFEDSHLSVGTPVSANQVLGYIGSTGSSSGNHLHFQIDRDYGGYSHPFYPSFIGLREDDPDPNNRLLEFTMSPMAFIQNFGGSSGRFDDLEKEKADFMHFFFGQ